MEFGEFMALAAIMVTIVAVFGILSDMYKRRLTFLERKLEIMAGHTAEKAAQYASKSGEIEARLRVLERIATDGVHGSAAALGIAAQIDALRDTAPATLPAFKETTTQ